MTHGHFLKVYSPLNPILPHIRSPVKRICYKKMVPDKKTPDGYCPKVHRYSFRVSGQELFRVPIGSCLSGGIDSSAIVCILDTMINQPFFTYSLIFPGNKIDESRYMKEVGKYTRIQQQYTTLNTTDFLQDLPDFIKAQEEPATGLSVYGQYCIMRLASENHAKVLLDGQGGDEIFAAIPTTLHTTIMNF